MNNEIENEFEIEKVVRIVDYKAGNAPSVMHAVTRLGFAAEYARGPGDIEGATHILLPGVGSAKATMESLGELGLTGALGDAVMGAGKLFLGICVGLQLIFEHSEEGGGADCFGWLKGQVHRFDQAKVRVPQMGWNRTSFVKDVAFPARDDYFYYVNSYYARPADSADIWGKSSHGDEFAAAIHSGNIYATQFHIEKSGEAGLALLGGFLSLDCGPRRKRGPGKTEGAAC